VAEAVSLWMLRREMGARSLVDDRFVARAHRRHESVATQGTGLFIFR
jgi:hypothetical protein